LTANPTDTVNFFIIPKTSTFTITMNKSKTFFVIFLILLGLIASDCKYRKDCGGRRKKKIKTGMGGYM